MKSAAITFIFSLLGQVFVSGAPLRYAVDRPLESATVRYRIDPAQSRFMVIAPRGGLAWFKGHTHYLAVRDFAGEVELTPGAITPASLTMTVRAASLEETGANFTPQQKAIIKKELEKIALETAKYPEITFRSSDVQVRMNKNALEVGITGDLTLHGVTRQIEIPATVILDGDTLRAVGEFEIDRKDFNVKATTAFQGLVRVKHSLKFTFDIIARKVT